MRSSELGEKRGSFNPAARHLPHIGNDLVDCDARAILPACAKTAVVGIDEEPFESLEARAILDTEKRSHQR